MKSSYDKLVFSPNLNAPQQMLDNLETQGVELKHMTPPRPTSKPESLMLVTPGGSEMRVCQVTKFGVLAKGLTPERNRAKPSRKRQTPNSSQLSVFGPPSLIVSSTTMFSKMSQHINKQVLDIAKKTPRRSQVGVMKESSSAHFESGTNANWSHSVGHCLGGGETKENLEPATRTTNLAIYAAIERPIKKRVRDENYCVDLEVTNIYEEVTVPSRVVYQADWRSPGAISFFRQSTVFSPASKEPITPKALEAMGTVFKFGIAEL